MWACTETKNFLIDEIIRTDSELFSASVNAPWQKYRSTDVRFSSGPTPIERVFLDLTRFEHTENSIGW
jgi:hypothetical protein